MVFHALTFARPRGRCWKPRPVAAVFNTSLGTWRMLMHWKPMFDRYYSIKTENICYISRYFLHYFVSPFHRCLANAISADYARSRAGQYTSRICGPGTIISKYCRQNDPPPPSPSPLDVSTHLNQYLLTNCRIYPDYSDRQLEQTVWTEITCRKCGVWSRSTLFATQCFWDTLTSSKLDLLKLSEKKFR